MMLRMIRPFVQADLLVVREIFREYAAWVGNEVCFESFERELAGLPGGYAPTQGGLYLADAGLRLAGCAAFRPLQPGIAEMKRLYVRPEFRGTGIGRSLALRIAEEARSAGYSALRLDTLPRMEQAIRMYQALGFRQIPAYGNNPEGALCFEMRLDT
jgi:putative acetyltransferase